VKHLLDLPNYPQLSKSHEKKMSNFLKAHIALIAVNLIYGLNYVVAKDIMPDYIQPNALIWIRVSGATALFWLVFLFYRERVALKDLFYMALCAVFGVTLNQLFFFNGLNLTSPINAAIIMTSNPIFATIIAAILLKERLAYWRIIGVFLGAAAAVLMIASDNQTQFGNISIRGDLFVLINSATYALYLVMAKPLMAKYKPITVITLVFSFGLIFISLWPPVWSEMALIDWSAIPSKIYLEIGFVIFAVTFLTYLFNIFALKHVSPTVSSAYIYSQPVFAALFAWLLLSFLGKDYVQDITWIKIVCSVIIAFSVWLVSKRKSEESQKTK
jgi:drug/metabolite transporter (DMT)-like permease